MSRAPGILPRAAAIAAATLLATVALLAIPATPACAVWLSFGGGYNTYAMRDVNGDLDAIATAIAPLTIGDIKGGADLEIAAGAPIARWLEAGASVERLWASATPNKGGGSAYRLPAEIFKATIYHTFPTSSADVLGVSASLGIVRCTGGAEILNVDVPTASGQGGVSGTGPVAEAAFTGDWRVSGPLSIAASLGYRYARIGKVDVGGITATRFDGKNYTVDYSGVSARVALKAQLGGKRRIPEPAQRQPEPAASPGS
jgi:hypothetical protein